MLHSRKVSGSIKTHWKWSHPTNTHTFIENPKCFCDPSQKMVNSERCIKTKWRSLRLQLAIKLQLWSCTQLSSFILKLSLPAKPRPKNYKHCCIVELQWSRWLLQLWEWSLKNWETIWFCWRLSEKCPKFFRVLGLCSQVFLIFFCWFWIFVTSYQYFFGRDFQTESAWYSDSKIDRHVAGRERFAWPSHSLYIIIVIHTLFLSQFP